jgi:threonine dehydratase
LEALLDKKVYYKLEYLQPTRSFKVRGAFSKILSLEDYQEGVVTASGGNHGLAVAFVCNELKIPSIVYLPANSTQEVIDSIKFWGGTPVLHGSSWDEANDEAQEYARKMELPYIHAFDDIAVVRGQGTIAVEILNELSNLDALFLSVGGGGLISGVGMVAKQMKPEIHIYGVETVGAHAVTKIFASGKIERLPQITSIAKTLAAQQTTEDTLARIKSCVNDMQTVTDQEALDALKFLLEEEKVLVEPATSCIVASLLKNKFNLSSFEKIGIILCGANVSLHELRNWGVLE